MKEKKLYAHDCTKCEYYKGCKKRQYETPPCEFTETEMEYKRVNSQICKAGDIIIVDSELYIVTDSTVAEMDIQGTNLLIVNLDNGYLSVLPEVKQVEKVNTEINIINW